MTRKIVITGASSDIGLAICNQVIKSNDQAILQYFKHKEKLLKMNGSPDSIKLVSADFTIQEDIDDMVGHLQDTDILINVAGLIKAELLVNLEHRDIANMIWVNNMALVSLCQKAIPGMLLQRKGTIINISSVTASRGNRGQSVYAGTKGFIEAFSRCLAAEYGSKGIRVNCVAPGPMETGSIRNLLSHAKDKVLNSNAMRKLGTPKDIANVVDFLCSGQASFINGKVIGVDGGYMNGV